MTRNAVIAETLYCMAISLKKYNTKAIGDKRNHSELIRQLSLMQYLVQCIGTKNISDNQAARIINTCSQLDFIDKFSLDLKKAVGTVEYSSEYYDLLLTMSGVLCFCIEALTLKHKQYEHSVSQYILGFHNLPRAFLSAENLARISVKEAYEYFAPYCK